MYKVVVRHINLSGDLYSRLVYGEENEEKNYEFQKFPYEEKNPLKKWLIKGALLKNNFIDPRFRKLNKGHRYIYIVSLWGEPGVRKAIIESLQRMKKKYNNIKIVGYWSDPAFDLNVYSGCRFDMLVQSVSEQIDKWPNVEYLHVPVATLGYNKKNDQIEHDCFSVGSFTDLRLDKIINSEKQFHKNDVKCFWCIAGMNPSPKQTRLIKSFKRYREFPDIEGMSADETLQMSNRTNVMLNISRLPNSYQTNPSYYAVIFNKKLLIDSEKIKETKYFNPKYMKIVDFSDPNWLTPDLAKWIKKVEKIDYGYRGEWEPEVFYQTIREMVMEDWK